MRCLSTPYDQFLGVKTQKIFFPKKCLLLWGGKFPSLPPPSGDANACSVLRHRPVFGGQNPKNTFS